MMTIIGKLSDDTKQKVLATVAQLLNEPDIRIDFVTGVLWWNNYDTGLRESRQTNGRTLTIAVNGGADERDETPEEELFRLGGRTSDTSAGTSDGGRGSRPRAAPATAD